MKQSLTPRLLFALAALLALTASIGLAAEKEKRAKPGFGEFNPAHDKVEMFAAMEAGQIEVKFIPKDSTEARVFIKNKTDKPLNVQLPEAFAGVPVLAQFGPAGGGAGGGGGRQGGGGQGGGGNQGGGGGFGGGGGGGQQGGGGGGFFNVPPERVGELKVGFVCLEHGKRDPQPHYPYEIKPISAFTTDLQVQEFVKLFGQGKYDQRTAQVLAWHLSSKMSWEELAAKQIVRANGKRYPYFTPQELRGAMQMAQTVAQMVKERPALSPGEQTTVVSR